MIDLRDLALDAPDGRLLLAGLDLCLPRGGKQLLTGPSGSGKSRLLRVIAGTERPAGGQVTVGGRTVWPGEGAFALMGHVRLGLAFATGGLLSNLSLRENIALPLKLSRIPAEHWRARTSEAIEHLGLQVVADLRPHAVSAAARKHANLARVLALDPELILLDDPLEGLDAEDRSIALDLIHRWAADGDRTLVLAQEEPGALAELVTGHLDLHPHLLPLETP